ncbi:unnamed protein product [Peniophora sp. CBMAI 1063]|nr:unnamed protein product [Peniophora sp. CBMAI 1063]
MAAAATLHLLDICANYGVQCFLRGMSTHLPVDDLPPPPLPDAVPAQFCAEIRVVAHRIIQAMRNPIHVDWSADTYCALLGGHNGGNATFEENLRQRVPPLKMSTPLNEPLTVIAAGEIILIYLPDMLLPERQAEIAASIPLASQAIAAHPPKPDNIGSTSRWRHSEYLYAKDTGLAFGRGMTTLSPGWLNQAQEGPEDTLYVSADLGARRGRPDNAAQISAQTWLAANQETGILLSVALAISHPTQYQETRKALEYLSTLPDFAQHMQNWSFAFNVVTLICNRRTPAHRDRSSGGREFYDLLLTIGGGPRTMLSLPGLGLKLQYDSGAVALFSGNQHLHEVSGFLEERACIACYARAPVIRWLNANHPQPPAGRLTLPQGWWDMLMAQTSST